jgi:serine protease Do
MRLRGLFLIVCLLIGSSVQSAVGEQLRASFNEAVETVAPAVVNVFTTKKVKRRVTHPFFNDPFFRDFFQMQAPVRERTQVSLGSALIVSAEGVLITNLHVIEGATSIKVIFNDGREREAKYVAADEKLDLAVMRLELEPGEKVPSATFVDSDTLKVGDVVLAIGNPFGVGQSVSMGIISAVDRGNLKLSQFSNYIQTDAAINPGNSGGALVDSTGRVVGINTAIFSKSGASHGIGFAVPSNIVRAVLESILTTGTVQRPWFGATGQDLSASLAKQLGLERPEGVLINELAPDGPAQKAGIKVGDIIWRLDDQPVTDTRSFNERILATPHLVGRAVPLTLWRMGEEKTVTVRFAPMPERRVEDRRVLQGPHPLNGYTVEELSPALNQTLGLSLSTRGIVVTAKPPRRGGLALSLQEGDVIEEVNGAAVKRITDLEEALSRRARQWKISYRRGERLFRIIVQ